MSHHSNGNKNQAGKKWLCVFQLRVVKRRLKLSSSTIQKKKNNSRIKEANALLVKTKNLIEARENARDQVVIVSLYGI